MPDFVTALQSGSTSLWVFIPTAILLGALHGLEPGHSKTMMAAFIIAIRGTILQAILLGVAAALSHSMIIAVLAAAALELGSQWNAENIEPYMQLVSAVFVLGMAIWMFRRTRREVAAAHDHEHHHHGHGHGHHHGHSHGHGHSHDAEAFTLTTGAGTLELSVFEDGVPPVFRLQAPLGSSLPQPRDVTVETLREDGSRQTFRFEKHEPVTFAGRTAFLESTDPIPEPHTFTAVLTITSDGMAHHAQAEFAEQEHDHGHGHGHGHEEPGGFQDAHELEHAEDIRRRFAGQEVTTPQIVMFGLAGGLMPCPAAFSVLLICLQLKRIALGMTMVASFSFGLALTMVATGVLAAWSVRHAQKRFAGFGDLMRRAPYISCALLVIVAAYMAWHGWHGLRLAEA